MFKKNLWIVALLAVLAVVFVGCGDGKDKTPPTPPPSGDLEITDATELGALLVPRNLFNDNTYEAGDAVSSTGNVAHFNFPGDTDIDNIGFRIDFPADAKGKGYLAMEVTFKLVELTTLTDGYAKLGFKENAFPGGKVDMTPYPDYELWFGTPTSPSAVGGAGDEQTLKVPLYKPNKAPEDAIWFTHNKYAGGDAWEGKKGSAGPIDYKVAVTKIVFKGGEAVACCEDCEEDCVDCNAGNCTGACTVTCCMPPAEGSFVLDDFTELKGEISYDNQENTSGNTWKIGITEGNYNGRAGFSTGTIVKGEGFISLTIDYETDKQARMGLFIGGNQDTTVQGGWQGWVDLNVGNSPTTIMIPAASQIDGFAIENKEDGTVTITINSVTFNALDKTSLGAVSGGITIGVGGNSAPTFNDATKVVSVEGSSSSLFYFTWEDAGLDYTEAADTDKIVITYACAVEVAPAKVIVKSGANSWSDVSPGAYPTFEGGVGRTLEFTKSQIGAGVDGLSFQHNVDGATDSIYHIKILSVKAVAAE